MRANGILLHISSLSSPYGIGDLGQGAYEFADFLADAKQRYWQILPLNPTDTIYGNSPYSSISAFAGNPLFTSPALLLRDGFVTNDSLEPLPGFSAGRVDYHSAAKYKYKILDAAYERFRLQKNRCDYEKFCSDNGHWLDDFSIFVALKCHFGSAEWDKWPEDIRDRNAEAIKNAEAQLRDDIERVRFYQYIFFAQWFALKDYCNERGIQIIGDIPIYTHYEGADVWSHPEIFNLDSRKRPVTVAGVPPDYFSDSGQLWGNPVYDWHTLKESDYEWWIRRLGHNLRLFDLTRVDHFRGFAAYWEVDAGEETAINGRWTNADGYGLFKTALKRHQSTEIIAEDLGIITNDVNELIDHFGFPGMKILLFAFGDNLAANPYIPHNYKKNTVVYTGTHDNNTAIGWFETETSPDDRERLQQYIGRDVGSCEINWELIRTAMMSVANTAIIPMQDLLGLGCEARMNTPATTDGNWEWRTASNRPAQHIVDRLRRMTEIYGRCGHDSF